MLSLREYASTSIPSGEIPDAARVFEATIRLLELQFEKPGAPVDLPLDPDSVNATLLGSNKFPRNLSILPGVELEIEGSDSIQDYSDNVTFVKGMLKESDKDTSVAVKMRLNSRSRVSRALGVLTGNRPMVRSQIWKLHPSVEVPD